MYTYGKAKVAKWDEIVTRSCKKIKKTLYGRLLRYSIRSASGGHHSGGLWQAEMQGLARFSNELHQQRPASFLAAVVCDVRATAAVKL